MITAKIIADSKSSMETPRITTLELEYPRYIHAEFMTHRLFSRNAQSSRAIPVLKCIEKIQESPVEPIFMHNQPGMQADIHLEGLELETAQMYWDTAYRQAIQSAKLLAKMGVHKQIANRLLEPFSHIKVIITATEWDNFFKLRIAPDAQQEICELATKIRNAMDKSIPRVTKIHLPYISEEERKTLSIQDAFEASVSRCARVSYLNHDRSNPSLENDKILHDRLLESKHMSPFEHCAVANGFGKIANFIGWGQYRSIIEENASLDKAIKEKTIVTRDDIF